MKFPFLALAVLVTPLFTGTAHSQALTTENCQPLTDANRFDCCSAANWRDIILPEAQAFCDRGNGQGSVDDAVGSTTAPSGSDGGTDTPDTPGSVNSDDNPGNAAGVGSSGEKGMDNESPSTGTKGNSN